MWQISTLWRTTKARLIWEHKVREDRSNVLTPIEAQDSHAKMLREELALLAPAGLFTSCVTLASSFVMRCGPLFPFVRTTCFETFRNTAAMQDLFLVVPVSFQMFLCETETPWAVFCNRRHFRSH